MYHWYFLSLLLAQTIAFGDEVETIYITGGKEKAKKQPGSAHVIETNQLEQFYHTDVQRVLEKVPGVNIQEEDGEGLRPNIGLRGVHPHRSTKIVLMEDGILIAPAPYSAPAAYYFPLVSRMGNIEVFKGPVAVQYGPNTIGGAINMITRKIPFNITTEAKIGAGSFGYRHYQLMHGGISGQWGWLIEANQLESAGFKELDGGGDTGFIKRDMMTKLQWSSGSEAARFQQWTLKLGQGTEDSNETYLGLTQDDFKRSPYRRYRASKEGKMQWQQRLAHLNHFIEAGKVSWSTDLYQTQFQRDWRKFNGFNGAADVRNMLNRPTGSNEGLADILKGQSDSSSATGVDKLRIGSNDRVYQSQGLQTMMTIPFGDETIKHEWKLGLRFHQDHVTRDHTEGLYDMRSGELQRDGSPQVTTAKNHDQSTAIASFINYKWTYKDIETTLGLRSESVETSRKNMLTAEPEQTSQDQTLSPGAGAYYQWSEKVGLLFGIHQGYTLVGPGQSDVVKPENALNYEMGSRFFDGPTFAEIIGFYSDYRNIKGTCTFSSGCSGSDIDTEYNGGEAEIYGLEMVWQTEWALSHGRKFSTNLNYTYTKASFTAASSSTNPEWGEGNIEPGDPLPYIADHQGSLRLSYEHSKAKTHLSAKHTGLRYDQSVSEGRLEIPASTVWDWMNNYEWKPGRSVYLGVDNLMNNAYIVSLRPFGARPGKPRSIKGGVHAEF